VATPPVSIASAAGGDSGLHTLTHLAAQVLARDV
jgi:hypothetical protein